MAPRSPLLDRPFYRALEIVYGLFPPTAEGERVTQQRIHRRKEKEHLLPLAANRGFLEQTHSPRQVALANAALTIAGERRDRGERKCLLVGDLQGLLPPQGGLRELAALGQRARQVPP